MREVNRSVTIRRPRQEVYAFWRDLQNLPRFMVHLQDVQEMDGPRSHWVAHGPADRTIEWDAEIVDESAHERIAWRALPGADVAHEGVVRFQDAPADRGTEVYVQLRYNVPGGSAGSR